MRRVFSGSPVVIFSAATMRLLGLFWLVHVVVSSCISLVLFQVYGLLSLRSSILDGSVKERKEFIFYQPTNNGEDNKLNTKC